MKKTLLVVLFVMLAATMFAADLSVTLDAGLIYNANGLQYRKPVKTDMSDFTSSMSVAYDGESFGGALEFRTEAYFAPYAMEATNSANSFYVRNYGVYVKPCQEVKIAIDTGSVELLAENINWEPIFSAALFETKPDPKLIITWDVDSHLQVTTGVVASMTAPTNKVWEQMGVIASYEVFGLGKFIGKFESRAEKAFDIGLAFQLLALDTQDVYAGYAAIFNNAKLDQHRLEAFYGLNLDSLTFSFFDSFGLKSTAAGTEIGNRAALKVAYYINNITPSLTVNYYHNYGSTALPDANARAGHIWGDADVVYSGNNVITIDPMVSFAFGQGTLYTGVAVSLDLNNMKNSIYEIPLGISVSF